MSGYALAAIAAMFMLQNAPGPRFSKWIGFGIIAFVGLILA